MLIAARSCQGFACCSFAFFGSVHFHPILTYRLTNPTPNGALTTAALAFSMLGGKGDFHVQITYGEGSNHDAARCPDARGLHASDVGAHTLRLAGRHAIGN